MLYCSSSWLLDKYSSRSKDMLPFRVFALMHLSMFGGLNESSRGISKVLFRNHDRIDFEYGWGTDPSPYHWLGGVEWNWTILCYATSRIFWVQLLKVFLRPSNLMIQRTWRRAKAAARLALWEIAPWENCLLRTEIHYETIWNYCDNYELTRTSNVKLVWFINIPPFVGADSICPRRPNWGASAAWFISIIWMKSFLQPNPHSHMHWLQLQLQSILTCFYYIFHV